MRAHDDCLEREDLVRRCLESTADLARHSHEYDTRLAAGTQDDGATRVPRSSPLSAGAGPREWSPTTFAAASVLSNDWLGGGSAARDAMQASAGGGGGWAREALRRTFWDHHSVEGGWTHWLAVFPVRVHATQDARSERLVFFARLQLRCVRANAPVVYRPGKFGACAWRACPAAKPNSPRLQARD